jgi:hypothetical protein
VSIFIYMAVWFLIELFFLLWIKWSYRILLIILKKFTVLEIKSRTLNMLGKWLTIELHSHQRYYWGYHLGHSNSRFMCSIQYILLTFLIHYLCFFIKRSIISFHRKALIILLSCYLLLLYFLFLYLLRGILILLFCGLMFDLMESHLWSRHTMT